jgi:hypothetical protein
MILRAHRNEDMIGPKNHMVQTNHKVYGWSEPYDFWTNHVLLCSSSFVVKVAVMADRLRRSNSCTYSAISQSESLIARLLEYLLGLQEMSLFALLCVGSWCVVACLRVQIWGRYRRGMSGYILFQFPEISSAELAAVAAVV